MNLKNILVISLVSLILVSCSSNQPKTKPVVESNRERLLNLAAKRNQEKEEKIKAEKAKEEKIKAEKAKQEKIKAEKMLEEKKFYPENISEKEVHDELIKIQKNINTQNKEEAKRRIKELEEINKKF